MRALRLPVCSSWSSLAAAGAIALLLQACSERTTTPRGPAPAAAADPSGEDPAVAQIGNRVVRASEAEHPVRLALHDLEVQKFRLRRKAVEAEVGRRLTDGARTAELKLVPPAPPQLDVTIDPRRVRPGRDAPVTVLAFCNFESPHCARLQMTLEQVLPLFPDVVRYATRDLPLEFHRLAPKAAEAAHCAADQGNYWRYHDLLYAAGGPPDRPALERAARAASLEPVRFAECLDGGAHAARVGEDVTAARALGAGSVPTVFVNGRYAGADVQAADLVWLIERELAVRGIASPRRQRAEVRTAVPMHLRATMHSAEPGQGLALLAPSIAPEQVRAFREGEAIATGVVLRSVDADGIDLMREGRAERLAWNDPREENAVQTPETGPAPTVTPHRAVPVALDRDRVLVLLSDRAALSNALRTVPMTSGGYRQLRVENVEAGGLYELLGFERGDVILSVNEQPVHEASNPLWDALEREGEVRVRVMRRGGLARHFTYRFGG